MIGKSENEEHYTVEMLNEMKIENEITVAHQLYGVVIKELDQLKDQHSIFFAENHQVWGQYGLLSGNAKNNPNSDAIYTLLRSSRHLISVPNNREEMTLLTENRRWFLRIEQRIISKLLSYMESYKK